MVNERRKGFISRIGLGSKGWWRNLLRHGNFQRHLSVFICNTSDAGAVLFLTDVRPSSLHDYIECILITLEIPSRGKPRLFVWLFSFSQTRSYLGDKVITWSRKSMFMSSGKHGWALAETGASFTARKNRMNYRRLRILGLILIGNLI